MLLTPMHFCNKCRHNCLKKKTLVQPAPCLENHISLHSILAPATGPLTTDSIIAWSGSLSRTSESLFPLTLSFKVIHFLFYHVNTHKANPVT